MVRTLQYVKSTSVLYSDCGHKRIDGFSDAEDKSTTGQCVFVGGILCRGRVKSKSLSLHQVRSQNIGIWLILHVSLCRYKIFWRRWVLCPRLQWGYIVITDRLFTLHKIMYFMRDEAYWSRLSCGTGKYDAGVIEPKHVSSTNQLANVLTKPL